MAERSGVFVFVGPTLPVEQARAVLDATYLPPVQRGDVLALLPDRPLAIGIVDGYFESVPSVWHKEILSAMAEGVHVFGAASMGALRAAELEAFGMIGEGQIFDWYRHGTIDADDEVAVVHGSAESGFVSLSVAMVDVRDACAAAADAGLISPALATVLVGVAKAIFYGDRTYPAILAATRRAIDDGPGIDRMEDFLVEYGPGLKRRDALALLERMAAFARQCPRPLVAAYHLERTVFLERLEQEVDQTAAAGVDELPADPDALLRTGESLAVLQKKVLFRLLARWTGTRVGLTVSDDDMQSAVDDFRRTFGLLSQADVKAWAEKEAVTNDIFLEVIRDGVLVEKLTSFYNHQIGANLAAQLRMASAQTWAGRKDGLPAG